LVYLGLNSPTYISFLNNYDIVSNKREQLVRVSFGGGASASEYGTHFAACAKKPKVVELLKYTTETQT
jgi:hypothetical protein